MELPSLPIVADWPRCRVMEETPEIQPGSFEPVRGRRARRHRGTGEIWQKDLLHGDHWEVYKTARDFENGQRDRAVWSNGRLKEQFR